MATPPHHDTTQSYPDQQESTHTNALPKPRPRKQREGENGTTPRLAKIEIAAMTGEQLDAAADALAVLIQRFFTTHEPAEEP